MYNCADSFVSFSNGELYTWNSEGMTRFERLQIVELIAKMVMSGHLIHLGAVDFYFHKNRQD